MGRWWASAGRADRIGAVSAVAAVVAVLVALIAYVFPRGPASAQSASDQAGLQPSATVQPYVPPSAASESAAAPTATEKTTTAPATTAPTSKPQPLPDSISLSQLDTITGDVNTDPDSLLGKQYVDLVRQNEFVCGKNYADYTVPDGMTSFAADAGLDDQYPDARSWTFAVYLVLPGGTTSIAFKQPMAFGQHAAISIKLNGALRLRIGIEYVSEGHLVTCAPYSGYTAVWADAKFHR